MSRICLIAADNPLPLCDRQEERASVISVNGCSHTISFVRGFRVAEHSYYRTAVDVLQLPLKPFQYELELELHEDDLIHLKDYLSRNFRPGETAELWNIWVGADRSDKIPHFSGSLQDFDTETLDQFLNPDTPCHLPGQCRMTITI
jgi:hypothetical protein